MASSESVKDLFKQQTLIEPELVQMDKVLCKWFPAMCSKGNPVTGPMVIDKAMSFYDEMNVHGKCTFSEGINKKSPVRTQLPFNNLAPAWSCGCQIKGILLYIYL
jgi:hypothetical protein